MEAKLASFFASKHFAVAGASSDPAKFGHTSTQTAPFFSFRLPSPPPPSRLPPSREPPTSQLTNPTVFKWYLAHSLPVTPLNPSAPSITVPSSSSSAARTPAPTYPTLPSPRDLPSPTGTSLSVVTPPKVTRGVLRAAREAGVRAVWLQPGSFDAEVLGEAVEGEGAEGGFEVVIAGDMGDGPRGEEGWCVLVDGERGLRGAGKL